MRFCGQFSFKQFNTGLKSISFNGRLRRVHELLMINDFLVFSLQNSPFFCNNNILFAYFVYFLAELLVFCLEALEFGFVIRIQLECRAMEVLFFGLERVLKNMNLLFQVSLIGLVCQYSFKSQRVKLTKRSRI